MPNYEKIDVVVDEKKDLHWLGAIMMMINTTVGFGILSFPYAFAVAGGLTNGALILVAVVLLVFGSFVILGFLVKEHECRTYHNLVSKILGNKMGWLCHCALILNNFGTIVIFLVVFRNMTDKVSEILINDEIRLKYNLTGTFITPLCATLMILPLCLVKRLKVFEYTSILGIIGISFITFVVSIGGYMNYLPVSNIEQVNSMAETNIMKVIPMFCFSLECHIEMPPVRSSLQDQSMSHYIGILTGYLIVAAAMYSMTGVLGYLKFGSEAMENVLEAYDIQNPIIIITTILLLIKIITTYPLVFYAVRATVEEMVISIRDAINERMNNRSLDERTRLIQGDESINTQESIFRKSLTYISNKKRTIIVSFTIFILSVVCAMIVPGITNMIALTGGISVLFTFFFPGLCLIKYHQTGRKKMVKNLIGFIYFAFGSSIFITSTAMAMKEFKTL